MYSPAAIENAPASNPATPDTNTARLSPVAPAAPATPRIRQTFATRPSLAPNTAARTLPPAMPPRCRRPISSTECGIGWPDGCDDVEYTDIPLTFIAASTL